MNASDETAIVIVAAGRGERAGSSVAGPKQYRQIGGEPVIRHTIRAFAAHPGVGRIVVAIHADDHGLFAEAVKGFEVRVEPVIGGATRQESTRLALEALAQTPPRTVLIHDAVRPFVSGGLISRVIDVARLGHGALAATPVSDTIKRKTSSGLETVDRSTLFAAQTPQGFPFDLIRGAHDMAKASGRSDFTDDASIAEWAGIKVELVTGSPENIKLTYPEDLAMAEQRLARAIAFPDVRTGNGYDVHSFEAGDHVVLCGVKIAHDQKLSGHSDADVGLHALTDALLATCGAGDIGTHFPPSEAKWKGAASSLFVEHAAKIVRARGGRIANADVTLICEAPKVGPHRDAMTASIASMLAITPDRVSIKATTNEKLGFVGRKEGIAAIATASVVFPGSLPE